MEPDEFGKLFSATGKGVEIDKKSGGKRPLGIPTVSDRVAQAVVKRELEILLEPVFHADSYGYRPHRSAQDALRQAQVRCWKYDWVIDLDIQWFFEEIPHDLLMKAVKKHTASKWHLLYIERWLKAPVQQADGQVRAKEKGTPQGGVISPLLANLYLHYCFDEWMKRNLGHCPFALGRVNNALKDIAVELNPQIRGWFHNYGQFYVTELKKQLQCINGRLLLWVRRKYKRLRSRWKALAWLRAVAIAQPALFEHWKQGVTPLVRQ